MPSLKDIAKQLSTITQVNLQTKPTRAIDTGNLLRTIKSYNTPSRMVKEIRTQDEYSFEIELDYSPPGAEYGKFVNDGTSKMAARPFATNALESPIIQSMLDDYYDEVVNKMVIGNISDELDKFDAEY